MAAFVDNRRYHSLNGVVALPFKASTARNLTFPPPTNNKPIPKLEKTGKRENEDENSSEEDEPEENYEEVIRKGNSELEPSVIDPRDKGTADGWVERNPNMVRLTGKHPFNAEPPLNRLMDHGFITPVPLHYVRNHGPVPKASWKDWTVEVCGLVKNPVRFTMDQLLTEFPYKEFPVTLVCAGNRRKEQNMVKQTIGFNWGPAGISTSVWRGVPLRSILNYCEIFSHKNGAHYVCFEGAEDLPGGGGSKYGTSIKREYAMDPTRDIILAYMQNGEFLSPDHGFPVRVVIPGFIGGRMVKWLKRIIVTPKESDNYYHFKDNRVLPSHVDAELANVQAWWYKPEYIINELNINSVITTPSHEEILPINSWTTQRPYTLKGYAYSGGGKKVTRVEVTINGGDVWYVCELQHPEKPNKYGKYWCWCFWSLEVEVLDLLGTKEIAVRAWDETLNTQPEKLIWNVMGMMNNCWFRIKTKVCKRHRGEIGIVFEHPTVPGNQSGGWMAEERQLDHSSSDDSLKKSVSTPSMNTSNKTFSVSEVKNHTSLDSAWIIVHGHVYDCTRFLKDHPGGTDSILINAGADCTEEFDAIHSDRAKKMLEDYRIGELVNYDNSNSSSTHLDPVTESTSKLLVALSNPKEKIPCKLVKKETLSHDVKLFRFALPYEDHLLGLPVGKHIYLCANVDGKLCMRAYTPVSGVNVVGYFDLVIKIYFKGTHPKFPNGGVMSQYLESLPLGSTVEVKGPLGHIEYLGKGNILVNGKTKFGNKFAMLAGGTGITPIYQIIQAVLTDPEDVTEMHLIYANRTEEDILLREELDSWTKENEKRLKVWYVVSKSVKEGWKYSVGLITEEIMRAHLPEFGEKGVIALACGPPPMIQYAIQPNLEKMGYDVKESLHVF